jgi:undecaprenyl diphosphate synthase
MDVEQNNKAFALRSWKRNKISKVIIEASAKLGIEFLTLYAFLLKTGTDQTRSRNFNESTDQTLWKNYSHFKKTTSNSTQLVTQKITKICAKELLDVIDKTKKQHTNDTYSSVKLRF